MDSDVFWYGLRAPRPARRLEAEVHADVVIVGGGMAGLSCAQRLSRAGVAAVVVERGFCGCGASGKSSGFVTPASELELGSLVSSHGSKQAAQIWEFVVSGVELIRANILEHAFECDYRVQDSLCVSSGPLGWRSVQGEHRARTELGFPSRLYDRHGIATALCTSQYNGGVRFGGTFAIDSYAYCQALRNLLESQQVSIYEGSAAIRIREHGVDTAGGSVRASHVVVCADRFIPELCALEQQIYHVQTFLGMSRSLPDAEIRKVFAGDHLLTWDSDPIYNYFRVAGGNRLLLGGGSLATTFAHSPPTTMLPFARRMLAQFRARFPAVSIEFESVWSGMLGVSKDLLPVMGLDPARGPIWYAGAATGLPWAAALGTYAADRILNGRCELDEVFSPQRKFTIGSRAQALLSTPLTYALSHGIAKYS